MGVSQSGARIVLRLQSGDKESASHWREFFKDVKHRGLQSPLVTLGIMDGLTGLEKVFKQEFRQVKIQRCQVHVSRHGLAKVPKRYKQSVADDMRSILSASTKEKSVSFWQTCKTQWERVMPSAVSSLDHSIDACLTFFTCPQEEWISLRTTNLIERLSKEFNIVRSLWKSWRASKPATPCELLSHSKWS